MEEGRSGSQSLSFFSALLFAGVSSLRALLALHLRISWPFPLARGECHAGPSGVACRTCAGGNQMIGWLVPLDA